MRWIYLFLIIGCLGVDRIQGVEVSDDYRYHVEVLAQSILKPMELEIAPDGRIFVNDIGGALHILHPETGEFVIAGQLEVFIPHYWRPPGAVTYHHQRAADRLARPSLRPRSLAHLQVRRAASDDQPGRSRGRNRADRAA